MTPDQPVFKFERLRLRGEVASELDKLRVARDDIDAAIEQLETLLSNASLAEANGEPSPRLRPTENVSTGTLIELAKREYRQRGVRTRFLPSEYFGEPAWDILLDLFILKCDGKVPHTTSVLIAGRVPSTTGLRWLTVLERDGFIERSADKIDQRVTLVHLTPKGMGAVVDSLKDMMKFSTNRLRAAL